MRDRINIQFSIFEENLKKEVVRKISLTKNFNFLTTAVFDSTTRKTDRELILTYPRKFNKLLGLIIILHYLDTQSLLYWRIYLDLEFSSFSWLNRKQKTLLRILLSNKQVMLKYLYLTDKYSSNEIFGNLIFEGIKGLEEIKISWKSSKITPLVYRRGYKDKGSRRTEDRWRETNDFSFTELQNEKENRNDQDSKLLNYILKFLREVSVE